MIILSDKIYISLEYLGRYVTELCEEFTYSNPQYWKNKRMGFSVARVPKTMTNYTWATVDGKKCLAIPRGGRERLNAFILKKGLQFIRPIDRRTKSETNIDFNLSVGKELKNGYPLELSQNQNDIIDMLVKHDGGLIQAAPGIGKTIATFGFIDRIKQPTLIIVHTSVLQKQWVDELREKTHGEYTLGTLGGASKKQNPDADVVVAIINSVYNKCFGDEQNKEWLARFGIIIADEVHHCPSQTFKDVIDTATSRWKVGVTGTVDRKDGMQIFTYDSLGKILIDIKEGEAKDRITDFDFYQIDLDIPIDIPMRTVYAGRGQKSKNIDFNAFAEILTTNEERNTRIVEEVSSDIDKGRIAMVLATRVDHAKLLFERLSSKYKGYLIIHETNKDENLLKTIKADNDMQFIVINSKIGSEGLDIPRLDALYTTMPSSNYPQLKQQLARVRRFCEGKPMPFIKDFVDNLALVPSMKNGVMVKEPVFSYTALGRRKFYKKLKKEYINS